MLRKKTIFIIIVSRIPKGIRHDCVRGQVVNHRTVDPAACIHTHVHRDSEHPSMSVVFFFFFRFRFRQSDGARVRYLSKQTFHDVHTTGINPCYAVPTILHGQRTDAIICLSDPRIGVRLSLAYPTMRLPSRENSFFKMSVHTSHNITSPRTVSFPSPRPRITYRHTRVAAIRVSLLFSFYDLQM